VGLQKRGGLILLALLFLIGCGKDHNSNTHVEEGASKGAISVDVSDGNPLTRPFYIWEDINGIKTAMNLKVEQLSPLTTVWEVVSPLPQENLTSPVIHAVSQPGTADTIAGGDLQTDVWYRVTVTKGDLTTFGSREFLIKP
jgi:hypothetical protein